MKRFFAVIIMAGVMSGTVGAVSGCSAGGLVNAGGAAPKLDMPFSAEADISYEGTDCTAKIKRFTAGKWEFCLTEPYALQGLIITADKSGTKLKMLGMETNADVTGDAVSMAKAVAAAYDAAAVSTSALNENGALTGSSEYGGYEVRFDDAGSPASVTAEAGRLHVEIKGFGVIEYDREDSEEEDAVLVE